MKRPFPRGPLHSVFVFVCCLMFFWHGSEAEARQSLRVASFNIQVFGPTKINKPFINQTLLSILERYDLIFIQEIRDSENTAIHILLDHLRQATSRDFQLRLSERLGRGEMKEQYAYIFDADKVSALDSYVFDDPGDTFEREPFVGHFQAGDMQFTIAGIHITPTDVQAELTGLGAVHREVQRRFDNRNMFILGDFNADCIYYKPKLGFDYFDVAPTLLVSDDEDTTVGATNCAYDRVFAFGSIVERTSMAQAFDFQAAFGLDLASAKLVSDHYPIEFTIDLDDGSGGPDDVEGPSLEEPTKEESAEASCGLKPALSPKGYCMGQFDKRKQRVEGQCCL